MAHGDVVTTEAQIDAALERAKKFDRHPTVLSAQYEASIDAFALRLSTGQRFFIPREDLDGLGNANKEQLSEIEIHAGLSLAWPQLDVDHYFPYILKERGDLANWLHPEKPSAETPSESQVAVAA